MACSPEFFRFVRAARRACRFEQRASFFVALLRAACPGAEAALAFAVSEGESAAPLALPEAILRELQSDPLTVGWAHQVWNEPLRKGTTWGVSRRAERQTERLDLAAATQIYTDEYMAAFLCSRAAMLDKLGGDVCDPACGTGHLLVQALRAVKTREPNRPALEILERLYGLEIDPLAAGIARGVLVAEAVRLGACSPDDALRLVSERIVALDSKAGSLDRGSRHPLASRRYGCVLANPPYLGRRKLPAEARELLDRGFEDCSLDLCAAFMQRAVELLAPGGFLGLVTHDKWLRLRGYRALRNGGASFGGLYRELTVDTICELGKRAFDPKLGLHDGLGAALLTATKEPPDDEHRVQLISLAMLPDSGAKAAWLSASGAAKRESRPEQREVAQGELMAEPHDRIFMEGAGVPAALLVASRRVGAEATVVVGLQTDDDRRFVRNHWEVEPDSSRWLVHARGGGYGRWYGLNRTVLDWGQGREVFERSSRSGISASCWFEQRGWVYSWFANGSIGLRVKEEGWSFGRAASSGVFCEDQRLIAFLNSRFASRCARGLGGKVQLPEGVVRRLPVPDSLDGISAELVEQAVRIKREIVSHDITEITFEPGRTTSALQMVALEALLRLVEGALELQVARALKAEDLLRGAPGMLPVGLLPPSAEFYAEDFWALVPAEFCALRSSVEETAAGSRCAIGDEDLERAVSEGVQVKAAPLGLPADGWLERLCSALALNPLEAAVRISRLHGSSAEVRRALELPLAEQAMFAAILDGIGHPWWSQARRRSSERVAGVSRKEAQELAAASGAAHRFELVSGSTLAEWLEGRINAWQRRTFGACGPLAVSPGSSWMASPQAA